MRRTQIYLDQQLWAALHALAARSGTTVSELIRQAAREKYLGSAPDRLEAFRSAAGLWKNHPDAAKAPAYVRKLRRGRRLDERSR